ncbi:hypothetical protein ABID16_000008 [Rhizobium aquaticum]|uniref:L-lactate permease n=1 Tax=Rhizobium aquaticum TaxID=1549636 RepID=A0ABV2ITP0_9HYPH
MELANPAANDFGRTKFAIRLRFHAKYLTWSDHNAIISHEACDFGRTIPERMTMGAWNQVYDPLGNIWLSSLIAAAPIIFFFVALTFLKLKGYLAGVVSHVSVPLLDTMVIKRAPIVTGKMILPQSIAIACAATGLIGRESDLFRFTVRHSLALAALVGIITTGQAYLLPWMIP